MSLCGIKHARRLGCQHSYVSLDILLQALDSGNFAEVAATDAQRRSSMFETHIHQWSGWAATGLTEADYAAVEAEIQRRAASVAGMRLEDTSAHGTGGLQFSVLEGAAATVEAGRAGAKEAGATDSHVPAGTVLGPAGELEGVAAAEDTEEVDAEQVGLCMQMSFMPHKRSCVIMCF